MMRKEKAGEMVKGSSSRRIRRRERERERERNRQRRSRAERATRMRW